MSATLSSPALSVAPRLTFVTGPDAGVVAHWLGETLADDAGTRRAVLVDSAVAMALARTVGGVEVRTLRLPCLCCPALADFPGQVRDYARESGAEHLFVALPVLAAAGLLAEFDTRTGWAREFLVCLDAAWGEARCLDSLSYFQFRLISVADRVIEVEVRPTALACR